MRLFIPARMKRRRPYDERTEGKEGYDGEARDVDRDRGHRRHNQHRVLHHGR